VHTLVFPGPVVADGTERSLTAESMGEAVLPTTRRARVPLARAARLAQRFSVDTVGDAGQRAAPGAGTSAGGVAGAAAGANDAAVLAEGGLTDLAAAHANLEMRLRITTATNTRAVPAIRQRPLFSAPVAAHPLHARMFDGQDVEKGTQR
jgi:hypothetical protein